MPEPMTRKLILIDAAPRSRDMILTDAIEARLGALAELVAHYDGRMPDAMVEAHLDRVDIIIGQTPMDAARLARARQLKAIVNVKGNWEPTIDYREAQRRGVQVLSIAPMMAPAVAEACIGFAIALGRGVLRNDRVFREGGERYGIRGNGDAASLFGAEIGLVGYGNLGRRMAEVLAALGMNVLVHDPHVVGIAPPARWVDRDTALAEGDFVLCLVVHGPATHRSLDAAAFARMKRGAFFLNPSRGAVVDELALAEALRVGHLAGAGLDVGSDPDDVPPVALGRMPNVVAAPHIGGMVPEALASQALDTVAQVADILAGRVPERALNATEAHRAGLRR